MPRPKKEQPNRKDGLYEVKITTGKTLDGKLIRKSFYSSISKDDARRQAEDWKISQKVAQQTGTVFVEKSVTFADWARKWLEIYKNGTVKESTYNSSYWLPTEKFLIPHFGGVGIALIRPADIQSYYKSLKNLSPSFIKKIRLCLNSIFDTAIDNDICYKNPAKKVPLPIPKSSEEKRIYTKNQEKKLYKFALTHKYGLDIALLIKLGIRRGELLGLKWADINLENNTVSICRSVYTVNGKVLIDVPKTKSSIRTIPMTAELSKYLKQNFSTGYVIKNSKGAPMSPDNWRNRHYSAFMDSFTSKYENVPALNPHELRHTCGTLLYRKTKDIYAVSKFLGHADVGITTKIYVHSDVEALRRSLKIS